MTDDEIFAAITDERCRLADQVAAFSDEQWATPSLCAAWTCREVLAHLVSPLVTPKWVFALEMAKARGDFTKANLAVTARTDRRCGTALPHILRAQAGRRFTPPGHGPQAPLTDIVVHGRDILRPLGLSLPIAPLRQRAVLDFLTGPQGGMARRLTGFRWAATDLDWETGTGPTLVGTADALMLTISGRRVAVDELSGTGTDELRARLA
ncbi:MAG: maleylpyruvate isomerase family mycothiol-dependent enzyme [Gordonia sp. (in: high G+C Gram-positive bacteria)]